MAHRTALLSINSVTGGNQRLRDTGTVRRSRIPADLYLSLSGDSGVFLRTQRLNARPIFRLTRVTRIFQESVFTETTPEARAACRAGFFVARPRTRPLAAGFSFFAKKQENTGEDSHALSTRPKRESVRTPARGAQSGNRAGARIVIRSRRGHRRQAHRARGGRRHAGHSRVHGAAYAGDQAPADRRGAAADGERGRQCRSGGNHYRCGRGRRADGNRGRRTGKGRRFTSARSPAESSKNA